MHAYMSELWNIYNDVSVQLETIKLQSRSNLKRCVLLL